jgi:hypothetical protein
LQHEAFFLERHTVEVPSNTSDCGLPARLSLMILTESSVELARVERTLMPYFFSNAALTGRTSWEMIWVVYQITSPSFLAASIKPGSAPGQTRRPGSAGRHIERSTRHGHLMAFPP